MPGQPDTAFDFQPHLNGPNLRARPLSREDRAALQQAASDPLIWAGHPAHDRHDPAVFGPYFDLLLRSQRALAIEDTDGRIIGTSSFYVPPDGRDAISVGFTFLTRDHWGGRTNFALKRLMFGHVFETRAEVSLHIAPDNIRSQIATRRLGASHVEDAALDLGAGAHVMQCYRLERAVWAAKRAQTG